VLEGQHASIEEEVGDLRPLREATEALLAHNSRIESRRRNQLQAEFERQATPERVLALLDALCYPQQDVTDD